MRVSVYELLVHGSRKLTEFKPIIQFLKQLELHMQNAELKQQDSLHLDDFLEAGVDFIKIVRTEPEKYLFITVDRSKISTVGKKKLEKKLWEKDVKRFKMNNN